MNRTKNVKIAAAFAGTVLFLAMILRSVLFNNGVFQLMPIWLLIGFCAVNIVISCIPWLQEKKLRKVTAQLISVGIAVLILVLL